MRVKIIDKGISTIEENITSIKIIGLILVLEEFDGRQLTYLLTKEFKFSIIGGKSL